MERDHFECLADNIKVDIKEVGWQAVEGLNGSD
jgi:hypothetical protein